MACASSPSSHQLGNTGGDNTSRDVDPASSKAFQKFYSINTWPNQVLPTDKLMDRCCLYILRLVPNTCGFCVTSRGKIFIDSLGYSWTMNLVTHQNNTLPHQFLGVHLLRSTLIPQVFSTSSFWMLAVCKNGWRRPDESYQVISCVLTMVSFPGFPYRQCLITFSTRITSFPDSPAPEHK